MQRLHEVKVKSLYREAGSQLVITLYCFLNVEGLRCRDMLTLIAEEWIGSRICVIPLIENMV